MKRTAIILTLLALVLVGCGGSSGDTTVPEPPKAAAYEKSGDAKIGAIVDQLQTDVPATLVAQGVKQDSIEQKVYQSSATLQEISDFYAKSLVEKGWVQVQRMPGLQDGFYSSGFDHGTTHLVIGAVDASKLGGQGVVIYTAKGTK